MAYTGQSPEIVQIADELTETDAKANNYQSIVDIPFKNKILTTNIDLGIMVLLLVNRQDDTIDRVALSNTELAKGAVKVSAKPFHKIKIPVDSKENVISQAIQSGEYQLVSDWQYLFTPVLKPEEARLNQRGASIECSLVYPIKVKDGGALIYSFYQPPSQINDDHLSFVQLYSSLVEDKLNSL